MKDSSNILIGVLAGIAAGVAVGILLKQKQAVPPKKQQTSQLKHIENHVSNRVSEALNNRFKTYTDDFDDHVEHTSF